MLTRTNERYRGLDYVWGHNKHPEPGTPFEVAPGVFWVRFDMPISLDHINIWLLEDGDGWTVVDTCLDFPEARAQWRRLFSGFMQNRPIKRIICTHMHPDHIGLAGWLCQTFKCDLYMAREEFLMGHLLMSYTGQPAPDVALDFYRKAGFSEKQLTSYRARFGSFGKLTTRLPDAYQQLVDRQTLTIGGHYWQVIIGRGHSPEHVCLYCPALKLLIAGDQVLPRITSIVAVFPTEPQGNPLAEWLDSCASLTNILPADLTVLPAHQSPFTGLHTRLSQLVDFHRGCLQRLYEHLSTPARVVDCFTVLFDRRITDDVFIMAAGETYAHLNLLMSRGNIIRELDAEGVYRYRQNPDSHFTGEDDELPTNAN